MFRRLQSGLPKDPVFPVGLDALGYYINEIDEVRSKINNRAYFNYFLTKNDRYNDVQREAVHSALRNVVLERLQALGLEKVRLPLTAGPTDPHVPILVSSDIKNASRVVVVFTDNKNDLGVFAHRILGGKKGVDAGSAVDLVKYLQTQASGPNDPKPPGVIIANTASLFWWRKGKQAVTQMTWYALPRKSAVDEAPRFDSIKNTVPGNRTMEEHIAYVLTEVIGEFTNPKATIDIIGLHESNNLMIGFFNKSENWEKIGHRLGGLALVGPYYGAKDVKNEQLADYLKHRARAWVSDGVQVGMPICDGNGNKHQQGFVAPLYSLGPDLVPECLIPLSYKLLLDWLLEVSMAGEEYSNPTIYQVDLEDDDDEAEPEAASSPRADDEDDETATDARFTEIEDGNTEFTELTSAKVTEVTDITETKVTEVTSTEAPSVSGGATSIEGSSSSSSAEGNPTEVPSSSVEVAPEATSIEDSSSSVEVTSSAETTSEVTSTEPSSSLDEATQTQAPSPAVEAAAIEAASTENAALTSNVSR